MTNKQAIRHANRIIASLHRVEHLLYTAMNFESDSENSTYDWDAEWSRFTSELDELGKDTIDKLEAIPGCSGYESWS